MIVACGESAPSSAPAVAAMSAGGTAQLAGSAGSATGGGSANSGSESGGRAGSNVAGGGANGADGAGASGAAGASGSPAFGCDLPHAKGSQELMLEAAGRTRKVRLFVPQAYDGKTRLPLMLNLHGSTDNADNFAKSSGMEALADAEGFVVAGLEALAGMWNTPPADDMPDDVAYASATIDQVAKLLCIDLERVYASGFSGGGRTSSQLGCELPDKIAAIGPVAGVRFPGPCPGRAMPVITIHGLADTTNAYAGEGPEHPRWNESVEDAVLGWATKNGCSPTRLVDDPPGVLSSYSYGKCQDGATVKLIRMDSVEHAYPTETPLNAAKEVWTFVKAFSLP
jgi:polyhydroxybutyrate depolymerase